jgi:recombination protein RecR
VRDPVEELVSLLGRLPGVGERTATRLAFHILGADPAYATALGGALSTLHARVHRCVDCGNYGAESRCAICRDGRRDRGVICVVSRVPDLHAIERSGTFGGLYHVLHGVLAPLDGVGPADLPFDGLTARVAAEGVREIIIATPLTVEGEATALYIAERMKGTGVAVTRIASGVPHGGELEFTDQVTLGRALDGRKTY